MTIYPIAVLKVEVDKTINDVYVGEHGKEIAVIYWRLKVLNLVTGLPVVGIIDVLELCLENDLARMWRPQRDRTYHLDVGSGTSGACVEASSGLSANEGRRR